MNTLISFLSPRGEPSEDGLLLAAVSNINASKSIRA